VKLTTHFHLVLRLRKDKHHDIEYGDVIIKLHVFLTSVPVGYVRLENILRERDI
jgi:hypothetical protein